jgi:hypothetical protein
MPESYTAVKLFVHVRVGAASSLRVTVGRVNTARLLDMCGNHG